MIDAGLDWDAKTALQRAIAFSEYKSFWLEELLQPDDYEAYRKLAAGAEVRIAAGEEVSSRFSYLELMDRVKIDIVQVAPTRCGGFTEAVKTANLAYDRAFRSSATASPLTLTSPPPFTSSTRFQTRSFSSSSPRKAPRCATLSLNNGSSPLPDCWTSPTPRDLASNSTRRQSKSTPSPERIE